MMGAWRLGVYASITCAQGQEDGGLVSINEGSSPAMRCRVL
jgi:hypothetical protein